MKRYSLFWCMLFSIAFTTANNPSNNLLQLKQQINEEDKEEAKDQLTKSLQALEQQINVGQKKVDTQRWLYPLVASTAIPMGLLMCFSKDKFYKGFGARFTLLGLIAIGARMIITPKNQVKVDELKEQRVELLKKLKEIQGQ